MKFNRLRKYLSEPILLHAELPKLKEDWQRQFNNILINQQRQKLSIAAYYNVVLIIVVLVLLRLLKVFMQRSIAELLVLNEGAIFAVTVSSISLFITALL